MYQFSIGTLYQFTSGSDNKTAEELVKEGRADAVKAYLARIAEGGYA